MSNYKCTNCKDTGLTNEFELVYSVQHNGFLKRYKFCKCQKQNK